MSVIGVVENGKVVLPPNAPFAAGARVRVETIEVAGPTSSLADTLKESIGILTTCRRIWARNHDHYIHGTPKR